MDKTFHLALDAPGSADPKTFRRSTIIALVILILAAVIMGAGRTPLPAYPQFTVFHATFAFIVNLVTAFLLFGQFILTRVSGYLPLSAGFLFSALVAIPFLLTFPGAIPPETFFIGGPQSAIWTWHLWHIVFPALIAGSVLLHRRDSRSVEVQHLRPMVTFTIASTSLCVAGIFAAVTFFHDRLPVLYTESDTPLTPSFYMAGGAAAAVTVLALVLDLPLVRRRSVLHIWIAMVLLALLADVGVSLSAYNRYTLGWYFGRIEAMLASSVLLVLFLSNINRLYWSLGKTVQELVASNETKDQLLNEVRRRKDEFEALTENSTDIIARFDRDLRRVYVNRAIEAVLQRSRAEIIGKTHFGMGLPRPVSDTLDNELRGVLASGEPRTVENTVPSPSGDRHLHSRLIPEFGPDGRAESVLAISRDLTELKHRETALQESERKYRELVENLYEGIWLIDENCNTTFVNAQMAELLGYQIEEMLGASLFHFMSPQAEEMAKRNLGRGQAGARAEYDFEFRCKNGRPLWTHIVTTPLFGKDHQYRGALAGVIDITERKHADEILHRREQEFVALVEHAPDIVTRMDRERRIRYINSAIERLTGRRPAWFIGKKPEELDLPPDEAALRKQAMEQVFESGRERVIEHSTPSVTGMRCFHSRLVPEFDAQGKVVTVLEIARDITDLKRAQAELEQLTLHDPLTGLANRRYLDQVVAKEWASEARHRHPVAFIMADIDHFKNYNDRYGHVQGDECLKRVAVALQQALFRPADTLVRFGGEEFAILLPETDLQGAREIAERLRHAVTVLNLPHATSPVATRVTLSFGIAALNAHEGQFHELLDAADSALYRAKERGRDRVEVS